MQHADVLSTLVAVDTVNYRGHDCGRSAAVDELQRSRYTCDVCISEFDTCTEICISEFATCAEICISEFATHENDMHMYTKRIEFASCSTECFS